MAITREQVKSEMPADWRAMDHDILNGECHTVSSRNRQLRVTTHR
jgi:hypothetical protein